MRSSSSAPPSRDSDVLLHDLESLGIIIAGRRKELGLTLDEAAQRLGVGRRLLLELEHGKRAVRADTLLRVLNLLGYDLLARRRGGPSRA